MENETKQIETEKPKEEIPSISPLEEARLLAETIKQRNKEFKELLDRQERLTADARIEGKGYAGQVETKKVETSKEYAERIMHEKAK